MTAHRKGTDARAELQAAAVAYLGNPADEDAFRALYSLARPVVRGSLRRIPLQDREDVESNVWVRVLRYAASYDPEAGSFVQWVCGIVRRQSCEYFSARSRLAALPGDDALFALLPDDGADVASQAASREGFHALLSLVDERSRVQLFLFYQRCMSLESIAASLRMNVNTVRSNVSRARAKIARALEDQGNTAQNANAEAR